MISEEDWRKAIERTWIVRSPKQHLATFGLTNIQYWVVTEPVYGELDSASGPEGVVRTGRVIAERPALVTPTYALNLDGFSTDAYEYFQHIAATYGPNSPGILYQYKNEADKMDILGGEPRDIAHRINDDLEQRHENMTVVMVGGLDELWDVALLNFIYKFTSKSAASNAEEFRASGMLEPQPQAGGAPLAAVQRIERMFREVQSGSGNPEILKQELDRWGLFSSYEDRFLGLFRGR